MLKINWQVNLSTQGFFLSNNTRNKITIQQILAERVGALVSCGDNGKKIAA